ncbi:MAG: SIS domain-containing protein [Solirubrobacterales bacterium]|nr:SIS domain-containing protein [Solirubrobacterales bacterium]
MSGEMAEQPERLRDLIARTDEVEATVQRVAPRPLLGVSLVARGSSDHAAVYGRYLLEQATGKAISLAAPSLHTLYGVRGDYEGQLAIAISQSGRTPEIVTTLRRLCEAGARGLAITNDGTSEIAQAARGVIDLEVGEERAVPATKTVTAQLVAFAQIAMALGDTPFSRDELEAVPMWVQQVLDDPQPARAAAEALVDASHLIVVARGFLYGAALETALKIKETCSILADGYSSADLRHGPIAAVTRDFPVIAISAPGPAADDVLDLVAELRRRGARPLLISPDEEADISLPQGMPETLAPIVAVVRGQQVARALALALELDPDSPPGLSKVTVT